MYLCYIDESGDLGALPAAPLPNGNDQPVLIVSGLILDVARLEDFTNDFLGLKHRYFPGLKPGRNLARRAVPLLNENENWRCEPWYEAG